jgi:hypothetical protein
MTRLRWLIGCVLLSALPVWAGSALFTWQASVGPDLAGHTVYWGTASGSYSTEIDVGMATSASFANLPDGQTIYFAVKAYNSARRFSAYSDEVSKAMPAGDTTPPTVSITSPAHGATVPRNTNVTISATASDNVGVSTVHFKVNGVSKCLDSTVPYSCTWHVPSPPNKSYTLQATATDAANNNSSASVQVTSQ